MVTQNNNNLSRRDLLKSIGVVLGSGVLGIVGLGYKGGFGETILAQSFNKVGKKNNINLLEITPCDAGHITKAFAEGPFYTPNSPLKSNFLEDDNKGIKLLLMGRVTDEKCNPIPGAILDFWHVDQNAVYDNEGYRYRGHQYTDENGIYMLETLHPQPYDLQGIWRTAHLHCKVQAPNSGLLTTQLYFPKYAKENKIDDGYMKTLEISAKQLANGDVQAIFNFVLEVNT